jgi:hypothetical protein
MLQAACLCGKVALAALLACGALRERTGIARLAQRNLFKEEGRLVPSFAPLGSKESFAESLAIATKYKGHPVEDPDEADWAERNLMKPICAFLLFFVVCA